MSLIRLIARLHWKSCRGCTRLNINGDTDKIIKEEKERERKIYCIPCKFNQGKWNGEYDNWI